jgi:hypothetical protein
MREDERDPRDHPEDHPGEVPASTPESEAEGAARREHAPPADQQPEAEVDPEAEVERRPAAAEPPPEVEAWPARDLGDQSVEDRAQPPREAEAFDAPPAPDAGARHESSAAHAVPATEVGESTQCPRCGTENRPGIAFCRNCGQRLSAGSAATIERPRAPEGTQACPRCGTHNRAGVGFCQNCGANLRAAPAAAEEAVAPRPARAEPAPRRGAILGPVVLLIGAVGIATGWLLPFAYGTDSLWDRSFGTAGGYGVEFWEGYADVPAVIVDQAYFSLAALAPILVAVLVLLAIGGFVRAAPGPVQLVGLITALVWGAGLAALFVIIEVLGAWTGDLTALLRDLSPGGIIFFLAGLIVVIGSLTRFARG